MPKYKFLFLFMLLGSIFTQLNAQNSYNIPDDPYTFMDKVDTMLLQTNQPRSITLREEFRVVWGSLSSTHQEKVIAISKEMVRLNFTMSHEFTDFYAAITYGTASGLLRGSQLDDLLWVTESVMGQYSVQETSKYFNRIYSFFTSYALFFDSYDRLYAFGGSYSLDFIENAQDAENNPMPAEKGAVFRLNGINLTLSSPFDSVTIANTSGTYIISADVFVGNGGSFDWSNIFVAKKYFLKEEIDKKEEKPEATFDYTRWQEYPTLQAGQAYCEFDAFMVEALNAKIIADNSKLTYEPLLNGSIIGNFEYVSKERQFVYDYSKWEYDSKGKPTRQVQDSMTIAEYPHFISQDQNITISKLGQNVFFEGGFEIKGQKRYGFKNSAYAQFYGQNGGERRFLVRGKLFEFRPDSLVTSQNNKVAIYLGADSIFHTAVDLLYKPQVNTVEMIKDKNGDFANTPFINHHHKFFIYADAIHYNIEQDSLDIYIRNLNEKDSVPVVFESFDFFDRDLYGYWAGVYDFHPLDIFHKYYKKTGEESFTLDALSATYNIPVNTLKGIAYQLMTAGYLEYEPEDNTVLIGHRLKHQVEAYEFQGVARAVNKFNYDSELKGGYPDVMQFTNPRDELYYQSFDYDDMYIRAYEYMRYDAPDTSANVETAKLLDDIFNTDYMANVVQEGGKPDKELIKLLDLNQEDLAATLDAENLSEDPDEDMAKKLDKSDNQNLYDLLMEVKNNYEIPIPTDSKTTPKEPTGQVLFDSLMVTSGRQTMQQTLNLRKFKIEEENDIWNVLKANPLYSEVKVGDVVSVPIASMHMKNLELVLRGIKDFYVSKVLNVRVEPTGKLREVTIYSDRFIYLPEGEVAIGDTRFIGRKFFIDYSSFVLQMEEVENILFVARDSTGKVIKDNLGFEREYGGEIHYDESGTVYINAPDNKSGLKNGISTTGIAYAAFPMVDIPDGGYVTFDDGRTNALYNDTTKINFVMPEIALDSLYLKDPKFPGVFNSNIFPPFQEVLVGMPDGSMGFRHDPPEFYPLFPSREEVETNYQEILQLKSGIEATPSAKIEMYPTESPTPGAKMIFKGNELILDRKGLYANGELTYLTTTLKTDEVITFTPNIVFSKGVDFEVREQRSGEGDEQLTSFAQASGTMAQLLWYAEEDSLMLNNSEFLGNLPEDERVSLYSTRLFNIYEKTEPVTLEGTLIVRKRGLYGVGDAFRKDFEMHTFTEEEFHFTPNKIVGKGTEFSIYSKERDPYTYDLAYYPENPFILKGNFVDINFDLEKGKASVSPNSFIDDPDYTRIEFPFAQYKTSISRATWDLNKKEITMKGDEYSVFASTYWKDQGIEARDLFFNGDSARYDIANLVSPYIEIMGIPQLKDGYKASRKYLISADAIISPDSGMVVIYKDAEMKPLKQAQLQIDSLDASSGLGGYHSLFDGNIQVVHRLEFAGDATYRYINLDDQIFDIKFDRFQLMTADSVEILLSEAQTALNEEEQDGKKPKKEKEEKVDEQDDNPDQEPKEEKKPKKEKDGGFQINKKEETEKLVTVAKGYVKESDNFYLTSGFLYYGTVTMYASRKNLSLDGYIKTDLKNGGSLGQWMPYKRVAGDALLTFGEEIKAGEDVFTSGLHMTKEGFLYSTFVSKKLNKDDANVFLASGDMNVTKDKNKNNIYELIDSDRARGVSISGNKLKFVDEKGELTLEGDYQFLDNVHNEYLKMAGDADIFVLNEEGDYSFNTMLMINVPFPSKATEAMAERVAANIQENPKPLQKTDKNTYRLAEIIGEKTIQGYFAKKENLPVYEISSEIAQSILFSDAELHWSSLDQTIFSNGKMKLLSVFNKEFNAEVEAYFEIRTNPSNLGFSLYFVADKDWYFIDMTKNTLSAHSSDEVFNQEINSKITKKAKEGDFAIAEATTNQAESFKYKFEDIYPSELQGIQERRQKGLEKIEKEKEKEQKPKEEEKKETEEKEEEDK